MQNFTAYMELITTHLVDIPHQNIDGKRGFHRASGIAHLDEFLNNRSIPTKQPALVVIDSIDSRIRDNGGDSITDDNFRTFMVVKRPEKLNDFAAISDAKVACKYIACKIIAKMKHDRDNAQNGMEEFKPGTVTFFTVNHIGDGFYGCGVTLNYLDPDNFCHNPLDWGLDFDSFDPNGPWQAP